MDNCIFCKIINGDIPANKYYEDENMIVIADIAPKAEKHYLAIPKKHYKFLSEMTESDSIVLARIMRKIGELSESLGLANGYRLMINQGDDAMQTVSHLHIHILGGQKLVENDYKND